MQTSPIRALTYIRNLLGEHCNGGCLWLAGPAWEAFAAVKDRTCQAALKKQRDDRFAALNIVRQLVRRGVKGVIWQHKWHRAVGDMWHIG
jgi:hypothetical protein